MGKNFYLILFFFTSCISINDINYRYLTKEEHNTIIAFNKVLFNTKIDYSEEINLQEVEAEEILSAIKDYNYSCIYLWKPYCKGDACEALTYYSDLEKKFDNKFPIIIISLTYDLEEIKDFINNTGYCKPVYIIKYKKEYGNKIFNVYRKFVYDITKKQHNEEYNSYFLFKNDLFIKDIKFIDKYKIERFINKKN